VSEEVEFEFVGEIKFTRDNMLKVSKFLDEIGLEVTAKEIGNPGRLVTMKKTESKQLRAKLEIAKEALRFYADCENWWWLPSGDKDYMESIATSYMEKIPTEGRARGYETIGGKRARQALKEIRD